MAGRGYCGADHGVEREGQGNSRGFMRKFPRTIGLAVFVKRRKEDSMNSDTKEILVIVAIAIAVPAAIFGGLAWFKAEQCTAQWGASGMAHAWGIVQGCMVRRTDGTWIPARTYRAVSIEERA